MIVRFAVLAGVLVIAALPTPVHADVLLDGKTPVDTGHGETVGDQIRWTGCDGLRKTIQHPPYTIYKRDDDCSDVGPGALNALKPDLFGLDCSRSFHLPSGASNCIVSDEKLADYFFTDAQKGDKVTFRTHDNRVFLQSGKGSLVLKEDKWEKFHSSSNSISPQ